MWGSLEDMKIITIIGMPVTVGENLTAALDCLRSSLVDKVCVTCQNMARRLRTGYNWYKLAITAYKP
jgi:hypothetical protein